MVICISRVIIHIYWFAFLTVIIYIQPLHIGRIQLEETTMLYSALIMLIGLQFIQFSVFTGIFARRIGQIPTVAPLVDKIIFFINKRGYFLSIIVMLIGMIGVISTLVLWGQAGFGELNTTLVCKTAILFGSLFAVGAEILLFTLFNRVLKIGNVNDK